MDDFKTLQLSSYFEETMTYQLKTNFPISHLLNFPILKKIQV